ncbi:MAG: hypothetical protein ACKODB_10555 [Betaproteobacteria bacterium]
MGFVGHIKAPVQELLEAIEVAIQHGRNGRDVFGPKLKFEFSVALLDHSAKESGGIDAALRSINLGSVTAEFFDMAGVALMLSDQLFPTRDICVAKDRRVLLCSSGQREKS